MKHFLLICLSSIFFSGFSQGTLQFNQAILIEFTTGNTSGPNTFSPTPSSITVPAGKVWKIEQANLYVSLAYNYTSGSTYSFYVSNTLLFSMRASYPQFFGCPLWLPAGTYPLKVSNESGSTFTFKGSINALEFNVVP